MNQYRKIQRKVSVIVRGVSVFKDWPMWLGWRLGILKRDFSERVFRIRDGTVFYFNSIACAGAGYFQEIYLQNDYFKEYSPKDNDTIIDIGGHIGIFSVSTARKAKNLKIFAYEPSAAHYVLFLKNIEENHLGSMIQATNVAVAEQRGTIRFYTEDGMTGVTEFNSLHDKTPEDRKLHVDNAIDVSAVTLDDILRDRHISVCNFMKMDCEGEEFGIIPHATSETLRKIEHMAIEYHHEPKNIVDYLKSCGFEVTQTPALRNECGMLYAKRIDAIG